MKNTSRKIVSTHDLFPIISESLRSGQKVKFTVSGTSMLPWIAHNRDQVLLASTDNKRLKPGDIILFQNESSKYILHRIYRKEAGGYLTVGDACLCGDGLVLPSEIIGVVEKIYRKGKIMDCNSIIWRSVFSVWRWMLPIREHLLKIYFVLVRLKNGIKNKRNYIGVNHG